MEHLENDHKDHPDPEENSHKLINEKEQSILSLKESQWKMIQQHDQNFTMEGKLL